MFTRMDSRKGSRKGHARKEKSASKVPCPVDVMLDLAGREILRLFGIEAPLPTYEDEDESGEDEDEDK